MKAHTPVAIIYTRGVAPRDVREQIHHALNYCENELGHTWIDDRHRRRAAVESIRPESNPSTVIVNRRRSDDTGIRIERDWSRQDTQPGRRRTLNAIETHGAQLDLILPTIDTIARNHKQIDELASILEAGVKTHAVEDGVTVTQATGTVRDILELTAGLYSTNERAAPAPRPTGSPAPNADDVELNFADPDAPAESVTTTGSANDEDASLIGIEYPVRTEYNGGRPPKGFDISDDGNELVSNNHYITINTVIQRFRDGEISKTEAAEKLDVARSTVENLSSKAELYQLV